MLPRLKSFFTTGNLPRRMAVTGLIVRLLYVLIAHTYRIRLLDDHFDFGYEMGRIARSLATGQGYANPFNGTSGPSAWCPPLYPLLLALCFKLFGVYTRAAAFAILALNCIFSAYTAPAVYELACRTFATHVKARSIALWSGWLWALYPAAMQYAVKWVWDMSLTTFLFAWVLVLALHLRATAQMGAPSFTPSAKGGVLSSPSPTSSWALFGLLWGLIALSNSSLLAFLPACGLWILWPRFTSPQALRNAALAALVFLLTLAPWAFRNQRAMHHFIPLRDNFGAELYQSILATNNGFPWGATVSLAPASPDFQRYRTLGEFTYSQQQGERAKTLIHDHPNRFWRYTLQRIDFFWVGVPHPIETGSLKSLLLEAGREADFAFLSLSGLLGLLLALRNRVPAAPLYACAFFFIPLVYYAVTSQARFRHPLEPLITLLTVYLFHSTQPRTQR